MAQRLKAKVFIQGPSYYGITARVFQDHNYDIVDTVDAADMCVWTGGEDIYPGLYGEKPISGVYYSLERDKRDLKSLDQAIKSEKFLIGICRGAQLLNVIPNGGKLWQDVNNHGGNIHRAFDCFSGTWVNLNSVHHQALRITPEAEVLCWALESTVKKSETDLWRRTPGQSVIPESEKDMEAVWYPKTRSLCMQFHIEFGHPPTTKYGFGLIEKLYHAA